MPQKNESYVEVSSSPIYGGSIQDDEEDHFYDLVKIKHEVSKTKNELNADYASDESVAELLSSPSQIQVNLQSDDEAVDTPQLTVKIEQDKEKEEIGLIANYASDENAIFVSAEIYEREKCNFDELVEDTLEAEKRKALILGTQERRDAVELIAAERDVLRLNARLQLMSQYIDNLRVKCKQSAKVKPVAEKEFEAEAHADEKPSWAHIYAGVNRHRQLAGGTAAEFYQHKSNIISGLKTLYEPDGLPPSAPEFAVQPKTLLVPLLQHQILGLKWLLWRETQKIRGGILADDMGLGKTMSMIALIASSKEKKRLLNPKHKSDFDYKKSWEQQLQLYNKLKSPSKCIRLLDSDSDDEPDVLPPKRVFLPPEETDDEHLVSFGSDCNYNAGTLIICPMSVMSQWAAEAASKIKQKELNVHTYHGADRRAISQSQLRSMDLVITSYSTLVSEWNRFGSDSQLYSSRWERLILDEAHIIRNTKTVCFEAATNLKAHYHWALTGTPIQNSALDCFALLKFLGVPNFKDLQLWRRYLNQGMAGHCRMSYLIKPLMLRRTKSQLQATGQMPALPPLHVKLIDVQLTPAEMNVYQILSAISLRIFAQFLRQREQNNQDLNYHAVQTTPNFIVDEVDSKYREMYENFLRSIGYDPKERVQGIVILVLLLRLRQFCCHPGLMVKMLCDGFNTSETEDEGDEIEDEHMNMNGHGSIEMSDLKIVKNDKYSVKEEMNADDIKSTKTQKQIEYEPSTSHRSTSMHTAEMDAIEREKCQSDIKLEGDRLHTSMTIATAMKLLKPSNPIFEFSRDSAKLGMVLDILQKLLRDTSDKIIVVSQWTSYLAIIKQRLDCMGHDTLDFNGKMDAIARSETLNEFNNINNNKRILLLSLTAGGVGLNLNVANHLLMVDLHWNPQLERQAQDRIYRYGQKNPSYIYRFMCKDTVEQRIKALQDYKIEISNVVLNPEKSLRTTGGNGLSLRDLKKIFGMV